MQARVRDSYHRQAAAGQLGRARRRAPARTRSPSTCSPRRRPSSVLPADHARRRQRPRTSAMPARRSARAHAIERRAGRADVVDQTRSHLRDDGRRKTAAMTRRQVPPALGGGQLRLRGVGRTRQRRTTGSRRCLARSARLVESRAHAAGSGGGNRARRSRRRQASPCLDFASAPRGAAPATAGRRISTRARSARSAPSYASGAGATDRPCGTATLPADRRRRIIDLSIRRGPPSSSASGSPQTSHTGGVNGGWTTSRKRRPLRVSALEQAPARHAHTAGQNDDGERRRRLGEAKRRCQPAGDSSTRSALPQRRSGP